MTPAARYAAAIEVLGAWIDGTPVEQALTRWARGARYAGSGDRATVRDHVYDVLRRKGSCAALGGDGNGGCGGGSDARALILGLVRLSDVDPATVFTGAPRAPASLTDAEATSPVGTPDPALDVPDWMHPMLTRRLGAEMPAVLAALGRRAPLYLRLNRAKAGIDAAVASLARDGVTAVPVAGSDRALQVMDAPRKLRASSAYRDGWVEVQDLSAQRAVAAVDWSASGRILDFCAGGGGKTLAIADRTQAALFAHDAKPARLTDLPPRAARAGVSVTVLNAAGVDAAAPFDAVLCDVPCSGSGTWRRDPEAKWRLTPAGLATLTATQDAILARGAAVTAPGGMLVYMTCSLFAEENEDRAAAFEAGHPGWRRVSVRIDTPLTASDGFFTAIWQAPGA